MGTAEASGEVQVRRVIRNARLLTGELVDLVVSGGVIISRESAGEVGEERREVFDAEGRLTCRPVSDAHVHLDKMLMRERAESRARTLREAIADTKALKAQDAHMTEGLSARMERALALLYRSGTRVARLELDVDETWGLASISAAMALRRVWGSYMEIRMVAFPQDGFSTSVQRLLETAIDMGVDAIGGHTDLDADRGHVFRKLGAIAGNAELPLVMHCDEGATAEAFYLPELLGACGQHPFGLSITHCLSLAKRPENERRHWARELYKLDVPVTIAPAVMSMTGVLAPVAELLQEDVAVLAGCDNVQDLFVPLGNGNLLELLRMLALTQRLYEPEQLRALAIGATAKGFAKITGGEAELEPGSDATLAVFDARVPEDLIYGSGKVLYSMTRGQECPTELPVATDLA